jgi:hypothetical protein
MMVANVATSQNKNNKNNNSVANPVTASKSILSFFLPKNQRINLIHSKFNNTVNESLSSSIVTDKLYELEYNAKTQKKKKQIFRLSSPAS